MSFFAALPFPRGKTFTGPNATPASTDGTWLPGTEYYVPDWNASTPPKLRSNRLVKLRCVRNAVTVGSGGDVTTGNLRPKRLVIGKSGSHVSQVDGYARYTAGFNGTSATGGGWGYPVDEYVVSTGVVPNDIFYVVVEGPATVLTDIAQVVDIVVGDCIVALTGATSGATTAGHVAGAVYTNLTGQPLAFPIINAIGRALSAATSANTNADLLVDIGSGVL